MHNFDKLLYFGRPTLYHQRSIVNLCIIYKYNLSTHFAQCNLIIRSRSLASIERIQSENAIKNLRFVKALGVLNLTHSLLDQD